MGETYFEKMFNKTFNLEALKKDLEQTSDPVATLLSHLVVIPMKASINNLNDRLERIEACLR